VVTESEEQFREAAQQAAAHRDGAVVVAVDGTIQEQMGTKHRSAVEASVREAVLAAVTVSEETGRVTVFEDGTYDDAQRDAVGGRRRPD